jgi:SAM-dependent methyltransferase
MRKLIGKLIAGITKSKGNKFCSACESRIPFFLPHPKFLANNRLIEELGVIGSDLINYMCPVCHSHDRERHLILYLKHTKHKLFDCNCSILHFAPEKNIPKYIDSLSPKKYVLADLYPSSSHVEKIDMESINYPEKYFNLVIANHVLEHVKNDTRAISEIHRVLSPSGYLIVQTPYSSKMKNTIDDEGRCSDYIRTSLYGQSDHLRLYGMDFYEKICSYGFVSLKSDHNDLLRNIDPNLYGVNPEEPFMLFQKLAIV